MASSTVPPVPAATPGEPSGTTEAMPLHGFEHLLQGLGAETLEALRRVMRVRVVPAGTLVMAEGEQTNALYLIESGSVAVFRKVMGGTEERVLATLSDGMTLGEMALLDGRPRSAAARAETECRLAEINPADILALPDGQRILGDIRASLAVAVTDRMRRQTDQYIAATEREMTAIRERQHFGQFFLYALGLMTIGMLVNDVLAKNIFKIDIFTPTFAWVYLLIILAPTSVVIWKMKIPLNELGITTAGMKKSLTEGCALSVVTMAVAFTAAWVLRTTGIYSGTPVPPEWAGTTGYLFHSVLQEFVARGLLQSSFQRFLDDKSGLRSVVLASTLFGVFHIHFGFMAVMVTIVSGLLFGAVYLRHRNLAGVTILHFFAGGAAFWSGLI